MHLLVKKYCYFIILFLLVINVNKLIALPKQSSFLILDYNSNIIIDGYNEYLKMHPASLTKLVTLYILFDFIEEKKITFDTDLIVSAKAANMPPSKLWLKPNESIKVRDAINAMIVKSANDVSYTVAENLGNGNVKKFVALMNKKVKELKLKNTHFENSTGLTHNKQYSTAYDMAIIAKNLMIRYPKYYSLFSQKTFTWKNHTYTSTNQLLNYSHVDGLKTGYTYAAGYNLVVSSEINGIRVIIASMGNPTSEIRNNIVKNLVDNGIVLAQNTRFKQIIYKSPPQKIVLANNSLNTTINDKITSFTSTNTEITDSNIEYSPDLKILVNNTELNNKNNYSNTDPVNTHKNMTLVNNKSSTEGKIYPISLTKPLKDDNLPPLKQKQSTTISKKYFIQIGVFSKLSNAKLAANNVIKLQPKLQQGSLSINYVKINSKYLYRVRIYKFSQKEAYSLCNYLKNKKHMCFVGTT